MDLNLSYEERDVAQMIASAGYTMETHKNIETQDGYLLTLHRIPHPKNANCRSCEKRQPVLLVHGMLGCTGHFLLQGEHSLPYVLADAGYDVWMGNVRGVIYSREHKVYNYAKDVQYWQFSLHELGIFDMPAMIDYILGVTNVEALHYVGYSQGCVVFFIMCSERPEYVRKISLFTGLSPLIFVAGAKHPWLPILSKFEKPLRFLTSQAGWCGMRFGLFRKYEKYLTAHPWARCVIKTMIYAAFGTSHSKINNDSVGPCVKFFQGINFHCLFHAMQIFNKKQFVQYDVGPKRNLEVYGTESVRDYKVENATCPVLLYYSDQDWFMPEKNINLLTSKLSNVVGTHKVDSANFSHFDFLIAAEAVEKLYRPMVKAFRDLQSQKV